MKGKIVLISGPCGSGKTTVSRILAQTTDAAQAVHMHTDDFYSYIKKGYIEPWKDGSGDQNETVIGAAAACAKATAPSVPLRIRVRFTSLSSPFSRVTKSSPLLPLPSSVSLASTPPPKSSSPP